MSSPSAILWWPTKISLRSIARRILDVNDEIADLDRLIEPLVKELAPGLLAMQGVGTEIAGCLLVTAGDNPQRLRSEAGFAMLCGVAPIPASTGKTERHQLNRGGDRRANSAGCDRTSGPKPTLFAVSRRA